MFADDDLFPFELNPLFWLHKAHVGQHDLVVIREQFGFGLNGSDSP
jgi:hypothetical protein